MPQDFAGKTVGEFGLWGHDPGVWMKGILAEEYGVTPDQMSWAIGGTDHPIPAFDWIPQPVPDGIDVHHADPARPSRRCWRRARSTRCCRSTCRRA